MRIQSWSVFVYNDPFSIFLWLTMHILAAASLVYLIFSIFYSVYISSLLSFLSVILILVSALKLPQAFFKQGYLTLGDKVARWNEHSGCAYEGPVKWLWTSPLLIGLKIEDERVGFTLWLSPRRLGVLPWWQLQRWLRFHHLGAC